MVFEPAQLIVPLLTAAVSISYPALGEAFAELSGVWNFGTEGIMLISAAASFLGSLYSGNPIVGLLAGLLTGALIGVIQALFAVNLNANQIVFCLGLILLGPFLGSFMASSVSYLGSVPILPTLNTTDFKYPLDFILRQNVLFYFVPFLVVIEWLILYRTKFGLAVRSIGENPHVAASTGINVKAIRYVCAIVGTMIASLGGAFLIVGLVGTWSNNITAGRGFIAIAMVRLGLFRPVWIAVSCLIFGIVDSLQLYYSATLGASFPTQFFSMTPYLVGILVLFISSRFKTFPEPSALGKPFVKEKM